MAIRLTSLAQDLQPSELLQIDVIGSCQLTFAGRKLKLQSKKARAIVGALVLGDEWKQPREVFDGLLWGDFDQEKARASVRNAVYEIQKAFNAVGCAAFEADKETLEIKRERAVVDIWQAFEAARQGEVVHSLLKVDRATDALLSDLETVDEGFSSWLTAKRKSLHMRLTAILEDSLRRQQSTGASTNAESLARALMMLDPTQEEAVRTLIRARAAAGDVGGAFAIYKSFWERLESEFEIQPSKETQDLIVELRLQQPEPAALAEPSVASAWSAPLGLSEAQFAPKSLQVVTPRKLVLNVGAFDITGVRPDHRYLINGFRQELSACLVRFREWSVRDQAHTPAGALRPDPRDGEYTIDASAFEATDGVRLVLMLRDTVTNDYVWSERLDLSIPTWFEAQQQIVRRLATALNVNISAERVAAQSNRPHENYGAYDLWLKALDLHYTWNSNGANQAIEIYRRLIDENPGFALAYLGLANHGNSTHITCPGVMRDRARTSEALKLAREAVRLEPVNSRAQLCLAWSHAMATQPAEGHLSASLAYDLNDNDAWTRVSAVSCMAMCGMTEDVRSRMRELLRQDLLIAPTQWAFHATTLFLASEYEQVIEAADASNNSYHMVGAWKASALAHLGRLPEARLALADFMTGIRKKWTLGEQPDDETIASWFLSAHPICNRDDWQRLRDGLEAAGLPIGSGREFTFFGDRS